MKNVLMLCIGLMFLVACEKEQDSILPKIVVEQSKYTLDDQGKATISCNVTPKDFNISNLQMEYYDISGTTDDSDLLLLLVDVISVTKDTQTPGKWNVEIGLTGVGGKPYTPKPTCYYTMDATVGFFASETNGNKVQTTKFQLSLDLNPSL